MKSQIEDLLNAAKLLADRQGNTLMAYLISMAIIEARTSEKDAAKGTKAA